MEPERPPTIRLHDGTPEMTLDLVDLPEIARRLGVKVGTTYKWRTRNQLPEPLATVASGPVWQWDTIRHWAEVNHRGTITN